MAREGKVGILIEVKDQFSGALKKVGSGLGKAGKQAKEFGEKSKKALDKFSGSVVAMNQGLELAKKGWELLRTGIDSVLTSSLEARDETDELRMKWEKFKAEMDEFARVIGDVLLAAFVELGAAMQPVLDGISDWVKTNKELIASGLLTFIKTALQGLAKMARIINPIVNGWRMIAAVVRGESASAILKIENQMHEFDYAVEQAGEQLDKTFGAAGQAVVANFGRKVKRAVTDEMKKAQEEARKLAEEMRKAEIARTQAILAAQEKEKSLKSQMLEDQYAYELDLENKKKDEKERAQERQREIDEENLDRTKEAASGVFNTFQGAFDGVIQGTKSVGDAFAQMIERIILNIITSGILTLLSIILAPFTGGASIGARIVGAAFSGPQNFAGAASSGLASSAPAAASSVVTSPNTGAATFVSRGLAAAPAEPPAPTYLLAMASSGSEIAKIERDHFSVQRKRLERNRHR